MLNFFNAIVIGFVQGVAEFLPISSSGHLVLIYTLLKIDSNNFLLTIFLHVATLFSVIYVYRKDILKLIKNPLCKTNKLLVVASIPTVIIALIFNTIIEDSFNLNFILFGFIFTALILAIADYLSEKHNILSKNNTLEAKNHSSVSGTTMLKNNVIVHQNPNLINAQDITNINISYGKALIIGASQGLACFPGISRSGTTISTALMLNVNKSDATTFSFLLSIPVIIGSMLLAIIKAKDIVSVSTGGLITAGITSFIVGILSLGFLMKIVKKQKLSYFSYYLLSLVFVVLFIKFVF